MSQLDLALEAEISARHLSFVETGRSRPSREMVLRLAERLEVPLREQNTLLVAAALRRVSRAKPVRCRAGFRPRCGQAGACRPCTVPSARGRLPLVAWSRQRRGGDADARRRSVATFPPVTPASAFTRRPCGPDVNPGEWRAHILERLRRHIDATADLAWSRPRRARRLPSDVGRERGREADRRRGGALRWPSAKASSTHRTTTDGAPVDITLSELIESPFRQPRDGRRVQRLAGGGAGGSRGRQPAVRPTAPRRDHRGAGRRWAASAAGRSLLVVSDAADWPLTLVM